MTDQRPDISNPKAVKAYIVAHPERFNKAAIDAWIDAQVAASVAKAAAGGDAALNEFWFACGPSASHVSALIKGLREKGVVRKDAAVLDSETMLQPDPKNFFASMLPACRKHFDTHFYSSEKGEFEIVSEKEGNVTYRTHHPITGVAKDHTMSVEEWKKHSHRIKHPEKHPDHIQDFQLLLLYVANRFYKKLDKEGVHGTLVIDDHMENPEVAKRLAAIAREHGESFVGYMGASMAPDTAFHFAHKRRQYHKEKPHTLPQTLISTQICAAENITRLSSLSDAAILVDANHEIPAIIAHGVRKEGQAFAWDLKMEPRFFRATFPAQKGALNPNAQSAEDVYNRDIEQAWNEHIQTLPETQHDAFKGRALRDVIASNQAQEHYARDEAAHEGKLAPYAERVGEFSARVLARKTEVTRGELS